MTIFIANYLWNRVRLSLRREKLIFDKMILLKLWYIGQIYIISKYIKKEIEERTNNFSRMTKFPDI